MLKYILNIERIIHQKFGTQQFIFAYLMIVA